MSIAFIIPKSAASFCFAILRSASVGGTLGFGGSYF
jgi:hypothetical protein